MSNWTASDFIASDVVLDFLNTVGDQDKARAQEKLITWDHAVSWAQYAGLVSDMEGDQLKLAAEHQKSLKRLWEFREATFSLISPIVQGTEVSAATIERIENCVQQAVSASRLSKTGRAREIPAVNAGAELIHHRLALHLFGFLSSPDMSKIRECKRCSWLFIDRGRGNGRIWCKMTSCGNRAKAERFRADRQPS
ncbi:MAG: CGNR zinc finger domain-containing protein [Mesorhizobium sp.]